MTTENITFDFNEMPVRVLTIDQEPWWVAVDVCRCLDLGNTAMALRRLDEDEKGINLTDTLGGKQKTNIINESGLYSLILRSDKPEACQFKRWITKEVLPALRKTGTYAVAGVEITDAELERDAAMLEIVYDAVRALWEGRIPLNRAQTVFTGAKIYQTMRIFGRDTSPADVEVQEPLLLPGDEADFARLVSWIGGQIEKEWSASELRAVAVDLELFRPWLTISTADSPSTMARFGKLCERMRDKAFENWFFIMRGRNRHRRYAAVKRRMEMAVVE